MYLMSKSLGSKLRMYPNPEVLGLEEQMDADLGDAAMSVFYYIVFSSSKLEQKYIFDAIRLDRTRTVSEPLAAFEKLLVVLISSFFLSFPVSSPSSTSLCGPL